MEQALERATHRAHQYRDFLDKAAAFYDTQGACITARLPEMVLADS